MINECSVCISSSNQQVLGRSRCNALVILQQKYDLLSGKYKMSLFRKYWCQRRAAAAHQISSVAGRQSPGEEVGRVARIQPPTKLFVAQFRIFWAIAGTFPYTL